jgi:D-alanyl-D-alanine carboxypeptidase
MKLRLLPFVLALWGLAFPATAQIAAVASPSGPVMAGPYLVVDAATGETLLQRDAGAPWYPASLTKLMTLYLLFEELKAGRVTLASSVPFSQYAAKTEPSKLGIAPGNAITVEQAIMALVARSANDVAVAVAELLSGSEPQFAQRMTLTARRLGMTGSEFHNPHGLPNASQISTARDLGLLGLALVRDFPQYYGYFQTQEFMFGTQRIGPGVKLLRLYSPYADGLKTGFICASGFNIVASAVRDGRRLVAAGFGFRRADLRDEFMVRLFDEAFLLRTGGNRQKLWQLQNEGGRPAAVFAPGECGTIRYDMPGDAVWLGTFGDWRSAKRAFDQGQAELATLGFSHLGKEWILPLNGEKVKKQAAIIADLEPQAAQNMCAAYQAKRQFCQVKKPQDIRAPFSGFWR